ncbi:MAG: Gfo/Idh/MocA family oxidoreductase [Candidatus Sumerlaeaceae bacterium]
MSQDEQQPIVDSGECDSESENKKLSRRELLKAGTAAAGGLTLAGVSFGRSGESESRGDSKAPGHSMKGEKFKPFETVRVGIIGVGGRGTHLLKDLLAIEHVEVKAVCDILKEKAENAQRMAEKAGQHAPELYTSNEHDFENLCKREDLDLVYVATPWDWHVAMAVAAMTQGKHVGVEVPAAETIDDCWKLVECSEKTRRHCIMLENCCYGNHEMLVLNMVKAGLFGELTHGEAAYIHDLRDELFHGKGEGLWRRFEHLDRNGNLYPTHGLGPVARYMGIHHGDRFDYLVSASSPQFGLEAHRAAHIPKEDPRWKEKYKCGDMNTSIIKTVKGRTIMLQHDVVSPRPYDRLNLISGTRGTFCDYPARIFFDGQEKHAWQTLDAFKEEHEHPLWKQVGELARKQGGHGGMDFIMSYRLIQCMREGLAPDMDVYDAAAWSAPAPLSEMSVAQGSAPVKFPDFTRGRWKATQ